MRKFWAFFVVAVIGGLCLCGNAVTSEEATYCEDGIMPCAASAYSVNYESKTENVYRMVLRHPDFTATSHVASCACVAGSNVIGYFDRYDENLIPDHKSGDVFQGQFFYHIEDSTIFALVDQLYSDMGTTNEGTTVEEFKNGMTTFCNRKGKSISFSSCMSGGQFSYSLARSYMEANQPVVLFCSGYNVAEIGTYEQRDSIEYVESSANHVMVGFGYRIINYHLTSTLTTQYRFIKVASGTDNRPNGYYNIDYKTNINDAYAVNIY